MRTHKFLILFGDVEYVLDFCGLKDESIRDQIVYNEEPRLKVIECKHEQFEDNVVHVEDIDDCGGFDFIRDVNGKLWYFVDHMTKTDIINKFE
jgi:hypothetical protein